MLCYIIFTLSYHIIICYVMFYRGEPRSFTLRIHGAYSVFQRRRANKQHRTSILDVYVVYSLSTYVYKHIHIIICKYICNYIHLHLYLYLHLYIHLYIHLYLNLSLSLSISISIYVSLSIYICISVYLCVSLSLHIYIYIYIHTRMCTHTFLRRMRSALQPQ